MKSETSYIQPAKSLARWLIPFIFLLIFLAGGAVWMVKNKNKKAEASAKPADKPLVMELAASDFATISSRELRSVLPISGTLTPLHQATVKSKVAADVREILVQEGVKVARGQIIARLDAADLKARLASQQAAVDEMRARLALAEKNRETNLALLKQNFISQNAYDSIASNVDVSKASVNAAVAQLQIAQRAMDDAVVRAPMDGIVSKRYVQAGEKINFDSPIVAIVDLAQLELESAVPTSEIPRLKVGQEIDFTVDGYGGRQFKGNIARINPAAEPGTRSITIYVSVNNADNALKGGMFAKGAITLEKAATAPVVPISALLESTDRISVRQIVDGKIILQPVTLGLRSEDEGVAEVKSGLSNGAQVIIAKLDSLKPGSAVSLPKQVDSVTN
ncbi:MAG: efflux RND transporter periplasmic adaptor subunit [Burkholderiales bacterium]